MRQSLFLDVTQRRVVVTDVTVPIGSPETSVFCFLNMSFCVSLVIYLSNIQADC
jgi:hypothetical protein